MLIDRHRPPYKTAGAVFLVIATVIAAFIYLQFRGDLANKTQLTLLSPRAGLVVERGSKVTFNGVEIGRVARIGLVDENGTQKAKLTLDVKPRYISYIPANVLAEIRATTVFGNKYISFSSPENPSAQRISAHAVIDASAVTTEFNTLFETVTSIAEQVDPIKVNQTLTATAEALTGLGERFGESLENGNRILDDLNPQMPQIARDNRAVADLADVYADASPDLWNGLENATRLARTFNDHRADIDEALMAAIGFANITADSFERGGPYLVRGAADLVPTTRLLDDYQGEIFCSFRKFSDVQKRSAAVLGGKRLLVGVGVGRPRRRGQSVRLPRQPAAGERPRRPRGPSRLLAGHHAVPVACAVSGDGHRGIHRAVQPH